MPQIAMPTPRRPAMNSRSATSSLSDDEITPCSSPAPEPQEPITCAEPQHRASPRFTPGSGTSSRRGSHHSTTPATTRMSSAAVAKAQAQGKQHQQQQQQTAWHFDPTDGEDMDDSQLWQRMLDIQRTLHCYNSARMSAALLELEMGVDVRRLAPSRSCLDLMNESISDLCDEDKQRLVEWLHDHPSKRKRSGIWRRSINF